MCYAHIMLPTLLPDRDALLLDFDGTLVEIAQRPEDVDVPPDLPGLIDRLVARFSGAVALVSGRPVAELDRFLAPARFIASGLHGAERRDDLDGPVTRLVAPETLEPIRAGLREAGIEGNGVRIEDKSASIAVHFRAAPEQCEDILRLLHELAAPFADLSVLAGKMVAEVKPSAHTKATAVHRIMDLGVFKGRRPLYIGDDVTDEDGMRAASALGGGGVKVGSGPTVAEHRIDSVEVLRSALRRLAEIG